MRISDWSSDVCSSDLRAGRVEVVRERHLQHGNVRVGLQVAQRHPRAVVESAPGVDRGEEAGVHQHAHDLRRERGRARRRVLEFVERRGESAERSEEQTSELQSLMRSSYAVFCLKKKQYTPNTTTTL